MSIFAPFAVAIRSAFEASPAPYGRSEAVRTSNPLYASPDDDEGSWNVVASGDAMVGMGTKGLLDLDRVKIRSVARRAVRFNPHGRAVNRSFTKYALGRNCRPQWGDKIEKDEKARAAMDAFWRAYSYAWNWDMKGKEVSRRFIRDGENIIRRFVGMTETYVKGKKVKRNMLIPRFVDPELIRDPKTQREDDGIVTDPEDVETVKGYIKVKATDLNTQDGGMIPAADIIHEKCEVDANEKRGVPMIASVLPFIRMYDAWMMDRVVLNRVRSSVALVRTFTGSGTAMKAALQQEDDTEKAKRGSFGFATGNTDTKMKRFRPGTVINARSGVDYKFIAPQLQAADVAHDGRAILLAISAGTGLAEFMVSGDLGVANYASLLVADGPIEKEAQDFQTLLSCPFTRMLVWAVEYERVNGNVFGIPDDFDPTLVTWSFPKVVVRSRMHEVQADAVQVKLGIKSRRSAMESDGLDYPTEQGRMESEAKDFLKIKDNLPGAVPEPIDPAGMPNGDSNPGQGSGAKPGAARDRGPSKSDPVGTDTRATDPNAVPSNQSVSLAAIKGMLREELAPLKADMLARFSMLNREQAPAHTPPTPPPAPPANHTTNLNVTVEGAKVQAPSPTVVPPAAVNLTVKTEVEAPQAGQTIVVPAPNVTVLPATPIVVPPANVDIHMDPAPSRTIDLTVETDKDGNVTGVKGGSAPVPPTN